MNSVGCLLAALAVGCSFAGLVAFSIVPHQTSAGFAVVTAVIAGAIVGATALPAFSSEDHSNE